MKDNSKAKRSNFLYTVLANVFNSANLCEYEKTKVYFINSKCRKIYLNPFIEKSELSTLILKQNHSIFCVPLEMIP